MSTEYKITLLAFSANDDPTEQLRINKFFESLLAQKYKNFKIIFLDASNEDKYFTIPTDERITIVREKISPWNPAYIRNLLSVKVDTIYLCHINADCCYAPNFVQEVVKELDKAKQLVMCRKNNVGKPDTEKLLNGQMSMEDARKGSKLDNQHPCGECQGMHTAHFISGGGYNQGISKDKKVQRTDAIKEDTNLKQKHNKHVWIEDRTWLIHMWHGRRPLKMGICKKKKTGKGKKGKCHK